MDTIKHTLTLYPSKSSEITTKSKTFQKIIRLLAEHNSIWQFAIYQSKLFSPLNAIKYILKHLQHTLWTPSSIHLRYPSKSSEIYIKSQTFQKTLSLLVEHNSIWHFAIYQSKDCSPLNVINIFWSIFNTHWTPSRTPSSIHLRNLPIKIPSKSSEITTKSQTFQKTIRLLAEHNSIWHFAI